MVRRAPPRTRVITVDEQKRVATFVALLAATDNKTKKKKKTKFKNIGPWIHGPTTLTVLCLS